MINKREINCASMQVRGFGYCTEYVPILIYRWHTSRNVSPCHRSSRIIYFKKIRNGIIPCHHRQYFRCNALLSTSLSPFFLHFFLLFLVILFFLIYLLFRLLFLHFLLLFMIYMFDRFVCYFSELPVYNIRFDCLPSTPVVWLIFEFKM